MNNKYNKFVNILFNKLIFDCININMNDINFINNKYNK